MAEELFQEQNQLITIILIIIIFLLLMAVAMVLFFFYSRRKVIKTELEKANLEIEHQKEVLQTTIITQEEERKRIAQDMHDAISSKLNVVSLSANMLKDESNSTAETEKIAGNILKVTSTVLENSRKIAHDLLPPTLQKFGLVAALEELCDEVSETDRFNIKHKFDNINDVLTKEDELHIFRVAQELLNNAIKYSEAKKLILKVEQAEDTLNFEYQDDGIGMDLDTAKQARGLGLSGIVNRTEIIRAELDIQTAPNQGLFVRISKPLK